MRRLLGLLMLAPLGFAVPFAAKSCHRGGDVRQASGNLSDNLLAALFILGLPLAFFGLKFLFGKAPAPKSLT